MSAHNCDGFTPHVAFGAAVTDCYEHDDGTLWVGNGEYGSQVNFCPFCGFPARTTAPGGEQLTVQPDAWTADGAGFVFTVPLAVWQRSPQEFHLWMYGVVVGGRQVEGTFVDQGESVEVRVVGRPEREVTITISEGRLVA